jgi:hypothetical protein
LEAPTVVLVKDTLIGEHPPEVEAVNPTERAARVRISMKCPDEGRSYSNCPESRILLSISNIPIMKTFRFSLITIAFMALLYGCAPKYGCPANAVGAENAENGKHSKYNSNLNKF